MVDLTVDDSTLGELATILDAVPADQRSPGIQDLIKQIAQKASAPKDNQVPPGQ